MLEKCLQELSVCPMDPRHTVMDSIRVKNWKTMPAFETIQMGERINLKGRKLQVISKLANIGSHS